MSHFQAIWNHYKSKADGWTSHFKTILNQGAECAIEFFSESVSQEEKWLLPWIPKAFSSPVSLDSAIHIRVTVLCVMIGQELRDSGITWHCHPYLSADFKCQEWSGNEFFTSLDFALHIHTMIPSVVNCQKLQDSGITWLCHPYLNADFLLSRLVRNQNVSAFRIAWHCHRYPSDGSEYRDYSKTPHAVRKRFHSKTCLPVYLVTISWESSIPSC